MKIGIDARWLFRDVVNTQFALLGTLLRQNAITPYDAQFVLYTDEPGPAEHALLAPNVQVRHLQSLKLRSGGQHTSLLEDLWWFERVVPAAVAGDGVTAFVSPYYRAPRASVPVINMVHDLSFLMLRHELLPPHLQGSFKRRMLHRLHQFYCRSVATHTVTVSEYSKRCVVDRLRLAPARVSVCYNGVDTDLMADARARVDSAGSDADGSYLLYVGYNSPNKNLAGLLEGYSLLPAGVRARHPLVLRTKPGEEQRIVATRGLEQNVRYESRHLPGTGLAELVAGARALILVSHDEGFGLPAVEALAAGVPVVVSGGGALSEVTQREMIEVDPADPGSIACGIASALGTVVSPQLRSRCREIASRYSIRRSADALMEVIVQRAGAR